MKKFLIIALIGLLGLNGYLLNKLASLTTRFEKINNTIEDLSIVNNQNKELRDINNLIFQSNFKDDLVLNNFNLTIGIILGFFTILIGLGVYLSFQRIDEDIKKLIESKKRLSIIEHDFTQRLRLFQETLLDDKRHLFYSTSLDLDTKYYGTTITTQQWGQLTLEIFQFIRYANRFLQYFDYCQEQEYMKSFLLEKEEFYNIDKALEKIRNFTTLIINITTNNIEKETLNSIILQLEAAHDRANNLGTYNKYIKKDVNKILSHFHSLKNNNTH